MDRSEWLSLITLREISFRWVLVWRVAWHRNWSLRSLFFMWSNKSVFLIFRDDIRKIMVNKYLSNPDYNFEKVNRASLACGPLVKWAIAQVCLISIWLSLLSVIYFPWCYFGEFRVKSSSTRYFIVSCIVITYLPLIWYGKLLYWSLLRVKVSN